VLETVALQGWRLPWLYWLYVPDVPALHCINCCFGCICGVRSERGATVVVFHELAAALAVRGG
jgi:hypothetical protein